MSESRESAFLASTSSTYYDSPSHVKVSVSMQSRLLSSASRRCPDTLRNQDKRCVSENSLLCLGLDDAARHRGDHAVVGLIELALGAAQRCAFAAVGRRDEQRVAPQPAAFLATTGSAYCGSAS